MFMFYMTRLASYKEVYCQGANMLIYMYYVDLDYSLTSFTYPD